MCYTKLSVHLTSRTLHVTRAHLTIVLGHSQGSHPTVAPHGLTWTPSHAGVTIHPTGKGPWPHLTLRSHGVASIVHGQTLERKHKKLESKKNSN
jgi:hypothetical protein